MKRYLCYALVGLLLAALLIFIAMKIVLGGYKEVTMEMSITTKIEKIKKYRGYLYLNDSLQISPAFSYIESRRVDLYDFVQPEDSLLKRSDDNSIILIRKEHTYVFKPFF